MQSTSRASASVPTPVWSAMAFVRFGAIGFSWVVPLLGALSVTGSVPSSLLIQIVGVATCFHVFAFVSNDVADLPIDMTEPRRQAFPLVRGVVAPAHALALALLQVPVSFAIALSLDTGFEGIVTLSAAYVLLAIYNIHGKRVATPWVTDALQGGGWALLASFGIFAVQEVPTLFSYLVMAYIALFVQMVNGVHGGVRDLANDLRHGVRTTAIVLGARPTPEGRVSLGPRLTAYALALQGCLVVVSVLALGAAPRTSMQANTELIGLILGCGGVSAYLIRGASRSLGSDLDANAVGLIHTLLALAPILMIALTGATTELTLAVTILFVVPLLTIHRGYPWLTWLRRVVGWPRT